MKVFGLFKKIESLELSKKAYNGRTHVFSTFPKTTCLGKIWFLNKLTLNTSKIEKSTFGGRVSKIVNNFETAIGMENPILDSESRENYLT